MSSPRLRPNSPELTCNLGLHLLPFRTPHGLQGWDQLTWPRDSRAPVGAAEQLSAGPTSVLPSALIAEQRAPLPILASLPSPFPVFLCVSLLLPTLQIGELSD